jgi:site-specific recombinase XerD
LICAISGSRLAAGNLGLEVRTGRELRALRQLQREQGYKSPFVLVSERGTLFSTRGFQAMVERAAKGAGFEMKIHPHMLRHSCGYKLPPSGRFNARGVQQTTEDAVTSAVASKRYGTVSAANQKEMRERSDKRPTKAEGSPSY